MTTSDWAFYIGMVHAVTGASIRQIMYHLSYARGLQFQTVWWRLAFDPKKGQISVGIDSFVRSKVII